MDALTMVVNSLWAGLFAAGLGVLFTAPPKCIAPSFLCGLAGRFTRDALMNWGMNQNWSTAVATAVVFVVAVALVRRNTVSPVVLISGILPLGAAIAMFNAIKELMRVSSLEGEAAARASAALSANVGKVFTTSLAIALGLTAGVGILRLLHKHEVLEGGACGTV